MPNDHPRLTSLQDGDLLWPIASTQILFIGDRAISPNNRSALLAARNDLEKLTRPATGEVALHDLYRQGWRPPTEAQWQAGIDRLAGAEGLGVGGLAEAALGQTRAFGYQDFWQAFGAVPDVSDKAGGAGWQMQAGGWGWRFVGHVGMVTDGGRCVVDATPAHGVAVRPATAWLADYADNPVQHRRVKDPGQAGWGARAAAWAKQRQGRPYDWTASIDSPDAFYCTTLCYQAFHAVSEGRVVSRPGADGWPLAPYWLTPAELRASADLMPVP
jgi:hypothetical protein